MSNNRDDITLGLMKQINPKAASVIDAYFIDSYDDFIGHLYKVLNRIIRKIQENRHIYSSLNETAITAVIIDMLGENQLKASSREVGGRCDIVVEYEQKDDFLWQGEAKFDNSIPYVIEGYLQLTTRYAQAEKNQREGGVLIYNRTHNASKFLGDYKESLPTHEKVSSHNIAISDCSERPYFSFYSQTTGLDGLGDNITYRVRHMSVNLLHLPEDKSGRTAKSHQEKKKSIEKRRVAANRSTM